MHNDGKRGAVALSNLAHDRPPGLAVAAERINENLPHHKMRLLSDAVVATPR
jgi:hypothetical protein